MTNTPGHPPAPTLVTDPPANLAAYARKSDTLRFDLAHAHSRRLGDYQLHELLGEGGMGAVYRAHQISLDRDVAVKVLSAQWATADFADRFHHEAQNAARLEHPNIVAIHEVGTAEDLHFYSMHLVRGQTLAGKLQHDGKLDPKAAAALMVPIAHAIGYAHRLGVLHLDLKPANVLIDGDGVPHVADFGLARRMERERALANDEVCGTPSYMAPEQATSGLEKISPATDVWGLGAILYELVGGEPPFRGATPHETIEQVRNSTPRPLHSLVPTVPRDLEAIIDQCLTRGISHRYASADELAEDLTAFLAGKPVMARPLNPLQHIGHWVRRESKLAIAALLIVGLLAGIVATTRQPPHPAIADKSIAVLPFVNMSGDAKNEYFSDGITEEILDALTHIPDLKVAARTSAFAFKGKGEDLRKVGETLGVANVLEGSVQSAGDEVRITAQLIDAHNGFHLWSEKYDRKLTNVFAVEDEISKAIADHLQLTLDATQPLVTQQTVDPHAHDLYLRGLALMPSRATSLREAKADFEQAVAIDPQFAQAWASLSSVYEMLPTYQLGDWSVSRRQAEAAANRALALAPQSADAHAAAGSLLRDDIKFAEAEREFRKAIALNPGDAETHDKYAQLLGAMGAFDAAIEQGRIAESLNPLGMHPHYLLGYLFENAHRYDEAIAELRRALELSPDFDDAHFDLAQVYIQVKDFKSAEQHVRLGAIAAGEARRRDPAPRCRRHLRTLRFLQRL